MAPSTTPAAPAAATPAAPAAPTPPPAPSAATATGAVTTSTTTVTDDTPTVTTNPGGEVTDPRSVPNSGAAKPGKIVMIRRRGRPDWPAVVTNVSAKGLVTAVVLAPDHPIETAKNFAEIHPDDAQLTGWYFPED